MLARPPESPRSAATSGRPWWSSCSNNVPRGSRVDLGLRWPGRAETPRGLTNSPPGCWPLSFMTTPGWHVCCKRRPCWIWATSQRPSELSMQAAGVDQSTSASALAIKLHTRLVVSRIDITAGRRSSGMTQIRRGLDDLANFQARFGSQDLQSAASIHGRELAILGLRTAVDTGSPAAILQWLERSRAASTRLPAVRPPADPVLAEELGALRVADEQARAALLAGKRDPAAERRVAELRRRVRARSWTVSGSGRADRPPSLAAVRRRLTERRPDAAVVALFVLGGTVHALVVTPRRTAHLVLVKRDVVEGYRHRLQSDLDLLADERIPARLAKVAAGSMAASLGRLSDVFAPILGLVGSGALLIAAVGELATVPWSLLPGIENRPVTVSSSVTRAVAGLGHTAEQAIEHGVLVVAGPEVTNGDKEASAIAALHRDAVLLTGPEATGRAVLDAIPSGGLVHIAAHGHHERGNPLFSGVKLADGLLFGYDFAPNPSLPGQVVLSSCDVGQTDERPGGEPLGLVAASGAQRGADGGHRHQPDRRFRRRGDDGRVTTNCCWPGRHRPRRWRLRWRPREPIPDCLRRSVVLVRGCSKGTTSRTNAPSVSAARLGEDAVIVTTSDRQVTPPASATDPTVTRPVTNPQQRPTPSSARQRTPGRSPLPRSGRRPGARSISAGRGRDFGSARAPWISCAASTCPMRKRPWCARASWSRWPTRRSNSV